MSDVWLFLAVACLFLAIVLVGVFIDQQMASSDAPSGSSSRRSPAVRPVHAVGRHPRAGDVGELRHACARARRVAGRQRRATRSHRSTRETGSPASSSWRVSPAGWDAERVLAFKVIGAIVGFVGSIVILRLLDLSPLLQIVCVGLLTFVGFILPDSILSSRVDDRKKEILRTLSDTLDLLTISVEAGLSLNAAMAQVVKNVPGVLSSEFARMLQEIQLGVPRSEAFRHLAERTDVEELNGFALAMIQADIFGVSIASVLRTQAVQLRIKRRQAIEAKAQQTPVKIVFPLVLCILPALFVVIVGPGAIRIFEGFIQT